MSLGASLQLTTATFTGGASSVSLTCPDRTGLIGEYLLRADAVRTIRNGANPSVPASLTGAGTPVYAANSLKFSGAAGYGNGIAGLDTNLLFPAELTLIAVRKPVAAGTLTNALISWFGSAGFPQFLGLAEYDGLNYYNFQQGTPPAVPKLVTPVDTDFHFVAGSGPALGVGTVYCATAGVMSTAVGTTSGLAKSTGAVTIKLCPAANYQMDLAYAAVYNRVLTATQIAAAYATLKDYFSGRGLVVS